MSKRSVPLFEKNCCCSSLPVKCKRSTTVIVPMCRAQNSLFVFRLFLDRAVAVRFGGATFRQHLRSNVCCIALAIRSHSIPQSMAQ